MIEFIGAYPRGGMVRLALDFLATANERPTDIELVEVDYRFAGAKPEIITDEMPKIGEFLVTLRGANEGWFATIAETEDLALGYYVADLRLTIAGEVTIGPPATFQITEAVTRRPA